MDDSTVSLPTWMQLAVTAVVFAFAAGAGIWGYIHRNATNDNPTENSPLLREITENVKLIYQLLKAREDNDKLEERLEQKVNDALKERENERLRRITRMHDDLEKD